MSFKPFVAPVDVHTCHATESIRFSTAAYKSSKKSIRGRTTAYAILLAGEQGNDRLWSPSVRSLVYPMGGSSRSAPLSSSRRWPSSPHSSSSITDERATRHSWPEESPGATGPGDTEDRLRGDRYKRQKKQMSYRRRCCRRFSQRPFPGSQSESESLSSGTKKAASGDRRTDEQATAGSRRFRKATHQVGSESEAVSSLYEGQLDAVRCSRPGSSPSVSHTSRTSSSTTSRTSFYGVSVRLGRATSQSPSGDTCLNSSGARGFRDNRYVDQGTSNSFRYSDTGQRCNRSIEPIPTTAAVSAPCKYSWRERKKSLSRAAQPGAPRSCQEDPRSNYTFKRRLHILAACFNGTDARFGSESD